MNAIGFGERWRLWILECVSTLRIALLINDSLIREISIARVLRQGDYLFIMFVSGGGTSFAMLKAKDSGLIFGLSGLVDGFCISYLQFADDTIVFLEADVVNIKYIYMYVGVL